MQDKKEKVMEVLEKIELELEFLVNMMSRIGMDTEPLPNDILGVSFILDGIKDDIKKSMDILS